MEASLNCVDETTSSKVPSSCLTYGMYSSFGSMIDGYDFASIRNAS